MTTAPTRPQRIAAVFDLRRPASRRALIKVVGAASALQFDSPGKPFVILVIEGPDAEASRLAFESEEQILDFYRSTLRINTKLERAKRVQFVLRDVSPEFEETIRQATEELTRELAAS